MSKKWKELGSNGTVGAANHNFEELKSWLAVQRMKPKKSVETNNKKVKEKKKNAHSRKTENQEGN